MESMQADEFGDSVDLLIADWRNAAPHFDTDSVGVVNRLRIVDIAISAELERVLAGFDLSRASFAVLSTLARNSGETGMSQRELAEQLGLTAGTMSIRLERMERDGLIARESSPADARATVVRLTAEGGNRLRRSVPAYLDTQRRLILSLNTDERRQLSDLLRKLVVGLDAVSKSIPHLGIEVNAARQAVELQRRVGLPETVGILVERVDQGSRAALAGLMEGDLLVELNGKPLTSVVDLARVTSSSQNAGITVLRRGETEFVQL